LRYNNQERVNSNNCSLPRLASYSKKTVSAGTGNKSLEEKKTSIAHKSTLTTQPKLDITKINKSGKILKRPKIHYRQIASKIVIITKKEEDRTRVVI
jgi:hypothetical protein